MHVTTFIQQEETEVQKNERDCSCQNSPFGRVNPKASLNYAQQRLWCLSKELADAWHLCSFCFWLHCKYLRGIQCYGILSCIWMNRWIEKSVVKRMFEDLPGGPMVKNLPSNAGDLSWILGQGTKMPHAKGQINPHTTTREAFRLQQRAHMLQRRFNPAKKKVFDTNHHVCLWKLIKYEFDYITLSSQLMTS